ncbi:MAG: MATE family efflux transporter [Sphaerochaetaceae bacterium]|nr:MATE family efflux transporter [Sphaerochaetaceae bacterium]
MAQSTPLDLSQGPVNKQILHLAMPTMYGMMFQAFYDIVDMIWIGFISPAAVASATIFITLFWIVEVLNEIVGTSSVSMISQYHGAQDFERTRLAAEQTIIFKIILATCGAIVMALLLEPAYRMYSDDPDVIGYGLEYGFIRIAFIPVFFSSYSVNTIFRCTGDAKTPMRLLTGAAIVNIVLDPLLMFDVIPGTSIPGMGWGMAGAAIATVTAMTFSFVVGFSLLLAGKAPIKIRFTGLFKLDKEMDYKLMTVGLPSGMNLCFRNVVTFIILKLVAMYGTEAIAVVGVATRIYQFGIMPSMGIQTGSGIIVGHSLGADNPLRAKDVVRQTNRDCLLFTGIFALAAMLFPGKLLGLFMGGSTVSDEGARLLFIMGPCMLVCASMSGFGAAFYGSGENRPILYSSLLGQWCFQVPYALAVTLVLHLPVTWLWLAYLVGDCAEALSRRYFYSRGAWMKKRV